MESAYSANPTGNIISNLTMSGCTVMVAVSNNLGQENETLKNFNSLSGVVMTATANSSLCGFVLDISEKIQKEAGLTTEPRNDEVTQRDRATLLLKEINPKIAARFEEAYKTSILAEEKEEKTQTAHSMADILANLWSFSPY